MAKKAALTAAERERLARDLPLLRAILDGLLADIARDASAFVIHDDLGALSRQAASALEDLRQLRAARWDEREAGDGGLQR